MTTISTDQAEAIRQVQRKVRSMLDERQTLRTHEPTAQPSQYWTDFCEFFDYMLDLAVPAFARLRLHTYHLTGDNYQTYYFGALQPFLDYWGPWLETDGLPQEHILSEPAGGIGFPLDDGRVVSQDIARFQRSVSTLSTQGVLAELKRFDCPQILEIGGGYGGLALHLARILPRCRYTLVDLPETLVFSAAYLVLHAPEKRVFLYDPLAQEDLARLDEYDFVLLPDYRLHALDERKFDLAINIASLQEMRRDQVEHYLAFLQRSCRGTFYSCNRDHQKRNDELVGLFDLLRSRFDVTEIEALANRPGPWQSRVRQGLKRSLRRMAQAVRLAESGTDPKTLDPFPFTEHLCRPRPSA